MNAYFILFLFFVIVIQTIGVYCQFKDYKQAVKRVHKLGNVGIGQKKGGLLPGHIVLIACDDHGRITGGERMNGYTIFSKFKPFDYFLNCNIIDSSIYDFISEIRKLDSKTQKSYLGYLRALEALDARLHNVSE